MLKKLVLFTLISFGLLACSKDDEIPIIEAVGNMENAPTNYEDCGWLININGLYFKPSHLPGQYQEEGLTVFVTYEDLMTDPGCQTGGFALSSLRIEQIKPR